MEKIVTEKGKGEGRVSILRTIRTIEPGECFIFDAGEVDPFRARTECAKERFRTGARYSVSSRRELEGRVVICRLMDNSNN